MNPKACFFLFPVIAVSIPFFSHGEEGAPCRLGILFAKNNPHLLIGDVLRGSPSEKAGIKRGDIILAIGGMPVVGVQEGIQEFSRYKCGDTVAITLMNISTGGKTWTVNAVLSPEWEPPPGVFEEKIPGQNNPQKPTTDCSRWTVKGLSLQMKPEEILALFKKEGRWSKPEKAGEAYIYEWVKKGLRVFAFSDRIQFFALGPGMDAPVVSLCSFFFSTTLPPESFLASLTERWGSPSEFRGLRLRGLTPVYVTIWDDSECDVHAMFLEEKKSPGKYEFAREFDYQVSIDKASELARIEKMKKKAADSILGFK